MRVRESVGAVRWQYDVEGEGEVEKGAGRLIVFVWGKGGGMKVEMGIEGRGEVWIGLGSGVCGCVHICVPVLGYVCASVPAQVHGAPDN